MADLSDVMDVLAVTVAQAVGVDYTPLALPTTEGMYQSSPGFGQVTYTERSVDANDSYLAGQRKLLQFDPDMTSVDDELNPPFAGHSFWSNNRLTARAMGDLQVILVNLLVQPETIGGKLRVDLDVGSPLGPTGADSKDLFDPPSSTPERVTFQIPIRTKQYFMANGGQLYLTSTVPVTVLSESIIIIPISTHAES